MPSAEPSPSAGTWLQAGPAISLIEVTPSVLGIMGSELGAAGSLAGAGLAAGSSELLHAPSATVRAAMAPTATNR
ncbi:MAG: hypothetical protein ABR608_07205 [Pseudonocardiaceae bacterium]